MSFRCRTFSPVLSQSNPRQRTRVYLAFLGLLFCPAVLKAEGLEAPAPSPQALNPARPANPVKLIFIHHSTGQNWLADGNGDLGRALRDANYYVSDTNYGWGPADLDSPGGTIGDHTDIGHWYNWFAGPNRQTYLTPLFSESAEHSDGGYSRLAADPGGENQVVMFKSCFPNSQLSGSSAEPVPPISSNLLRGQDSSSEHHTVAHAKGIYNAIRDYFSSRPDKLFIVIAAPPLEPASTDAVAAANARAFNNWLVTGWLTGYTQNNIFVFDFFNVLTSNGGNPDTNDLGATGGNHHRFLNGEIQHQQTVSTDFSAYRTSAGDSHPSPAGGLKATGEFVPLLNIAYNCWKGLGSCPGGAVTPPECTLNCSATVPATATINSAVSFQSTANASNCSGTITYDWDFGDNTTHSTASSPAHTYSGTGSFSWKLTASVDGRACVKTGVIQVTQIPGDSSSQPQGLQIRHRSGQTFITWTERSELNGERYRVYRGSVPINAGNLAAAARLFEVSEGSSRFFGNYYIDDATSAWRPRYSERLVVQDLGTPLPEGTGLLVWTIAAADFGGASGGSGYYAVTTVSPTGAENTADFTAGNSAGPLAEEVADPLPVEISPSVANIGPDGHVFIQYMDLRNWNPSFHAPNPLNQFMGLNPGDPAVAGALAYAYDYSVYEPDPSCEGAAAARSPVVISPHGWGDNMYPPPASVPDPGWCAWKIYPIDTMQTWHFGFAKSCDYRLGNEPASGDTVVNYTEQRLLRMVYDLPRHPTYGNRTDTGRVYVYGHSMGGSGTLAMAMRYPEVFAAAYASEPMTNYRTSGDGGGIDWRSDVAPKWGSVSLNLPVEIRAPGSLGSTVKAYSGTGVWDWQNHQANMASRRKDPMVPFGLAHGRNDTAIEWPTQGSPAYGALDGGLRCWGGAVTNDDHTWLAFEGLPPNLGPDAALVPFYGFKVVKDESVPGFSSASGNPPLPPAAPGQYNGTLEWSASWNAWDGAPVDTVSQWRMSLKTTNGSSQTVDVTPRRLQNFTLTPGNYTWENRRVSDDGLVDQGTIAAGSDGLATVPRFAVTPSGNRLLLRPSGSSGCSLSCTASVPGSGIAGAATAFAAASTPSGCTGTPVYDWDFGDETAHSPSQNPSHAYAAAGTFTWKMSVTVQGVVCTKSGSISVTAACAFTISPASRTASAAAGSQDVTLTSVPAGCTGGNWTAAGNGSWLTVSPGSGTGPGKVSVSWTANTGDARSATAMIAGLPFAVDQEGVPYHPADTDRNWRIGSSECSAYGSAWRAGTSWSLPPNPIPIDYVANACFIWRRGESYHYDASQTPPWAPGVLAAKPGKR